MKSDAGNWHGYRKAPVPGVPDFWCFLWMYQEQSGWHSSETTEREVQTEDSGSGTAETQRNRIVIPASGEAECESGFVFSMLPVPD